MRGHLGPSSAGLGQCLSPRGFLLESRVPRPGKGCLMLQIRALAAFPAPACSFFVIQGWFLPSLLKHGPVSRGLFSHPLYMKILGCERTSLLREVSGDITQPILPAQKEEVTIIRSSRCLLTTSEMPFACSC